MQLYTDRRNYTLIDSFSTHLLDKLLQLCALHPSSHHSPCGQHPLTQPYERQARRSAEHGASASCTAVATLASIAAAQAMACIGVWCLPHRTDTWCGYRGLTGTGSAGFLASLSRPWLGRAKVSAAQRQANGNSMKCQMLIASPKLENPEA